MKNNTGFQLYSEGQTKCASAFPFRSLPCVHFLGKKEHMCDTKPCWRERERVWDRDRCFVTDVNLSLARNRKSVAMYILYSTLDVYFQQSSENRSFTYRVFPHPKETTKNTQTHKTFIIETTKPWNPETRTKTPALVKQTLQWTKCIITVHILLLV